MCWNVHRCQLWGGFKRFLHEVYRPIGVSFPIWIDGSFVRQKQKPSDVDVVLDLTALPVQTALPLALSIRQNGDNLKQAYHVDVWPRHPAIPNDITAYFQYVGPKAATELAVSDRDPKGILRVLQP